MVSVINTVSVILSSVESTNMVLFLSQSGFVQLFGEDSFSSTDKCKKKKKLN